MELFFQLIIFVLMLVMAIYAFRVDKFKISIKHLTYTAIFVVISVVLQSYSIRMVVAGFDAFHVGITQVPLMLLGAFLGLPWAFIGGLVQDLIGLMLNPTGFPFLGFTLNKILYAFIPALWFRSQKFQGRQLIRIGQFGIVLTYLSAMFVILNNQQIDLNGFLIEDSLKYGLLLLLAVVMLVIIFMLNFLYKKKEADSGAPYSKWIISVISVEIAVKYIGTPLWLLIMYKIPFITSMLLRFVTSSLMMFVYIVLGFVLYKVVSQSEITRL